MAAWNLIIYFHHGLHSFFINGNTYYHDLIQMISHHYKLMLDKYLLEIYDARFRQYIMLNEEYLINLQDRLPRTSVSTIIGRLLKRQRPTKRTTGHNSSLDCKHKQTSSFSPLNNHLIIWLDSYIGHPERCHYLKHKFHISTMLDIARPMLDYELCIDDLIQADSQSINHKTCLNTFWNKEECLDFLQQVESTMKILFITSNNFGEEIVPLIVQRVQMIYILVDDTIFSYEWTFDYRSSLLVFHDDLCLLVHLIRDLAHDFVEQAEIMFQVSIHQAMVFLKWAKKLYHRANELHTSSYDLHRMNFVDCQLEILERRCIATESDEEHMMEKDDKFALECDEG